MKYKRILGNIKQCKLIEAVMIKIISQFLSTRIGSSCEWNLIPNHERNHRETESKPRNWEIIHIKQSDLLKKCDLKYISSSYMEYSNK